MLMVTETRRVSVIAETFEVKQIMQAWLTNLATVERRKAAEAPQWIRLSGFLGYLSS